MRKHIRCGTPVITDTVSEGYVYVCPECDEDLYTIETYDWDGDFNE